MLGWNYHILSALNTQFESRQRVRMTYFFASTLLLLKLLLSGGIGHQLDSVPESG